MKGKKIFIAVLVLVVLSTSIVFAASINGNYNGYPIVKVNVNDRPLTLDVPGIVMQGRTLLPVRSVAENLNAIVSWDQETMTANIIKPEVSLEFIDEIQEYEDGSWDLINPYGSVSKGTQDIMVYYSISNIAKQTAVYKIVVYDMNNRVIGEDTDSVKIDDEMGMIGYMNFEKLDLNKSGKYKFELQLLYNKEFQTIAVKTLYVE